MSEATSENDESHEQRRSPSTTTQAEGDGRASRRRARGRCPTRRTSTPRRSRTERAERLDPENRPDNVEIDNTDRDFDSEKGMFTDAEGYDSADSKFDDDAV